MVHFKLSNLIEVTRQWDVVVGDMVKFIIPSEAKAETRVTRDLFGSLFGRKLPKSEASPFSIQILLVGFKTLHFGLGQFWKDSLFGVSSSSSNINTTKNLKNLKAKLQKGPELSIYWDLNKNYWAALAAKDLGDADTPDDVKDFQQMNDYTWEAIRDWDTLISADQVLFPVYMMKHYHIMKENQACGATSKTTTSFLGITGRPSRIRTSRCAR
jgi:hypothetical protein